MLRLQNIRSDGSVLCGEDFIDGESAGFNVSKLGGTAGASRLRLTAVVLAAKGIAFVSLLGDGSRDCRDLSMTGGSDIELRLRRSDLCIVRCVSGALPTTEVVGYTVWAGVARADANTWANLW
jgi:hypothetical protein